MGVLCPATCRDTIQAPDHRNTQCLSQTCVGTDASGPGHLAGLASLSLWHALRCFAKACDTAFHCRRTAPREWLALWSQERKGPCPRPTEPDYNGTTANVRSAQPTFL